MATIENIAQCFLYLDDTHEGDGISNLKLQKLVYYAQGFYSAMFDKPLFNNTISAWIHGPVVEDLYHDYKQYGSNPIPTPSNFNPALLNTEEFELVEEIHTYGHHNPFHFHEDHEGHTFHIL